MDKREIELAKQNIIKDRRRRLLYLNKEKTAGYHIPDTSMKIFSTLKNGDLIALLLFLVLFGIFGQNLVLGLSVMIAIIAITKGILHFIFLPKFKEIKLNDADIKKTQSEDYLKALESNKLSQVIIYVVLSLMILLRFMDVSKPLEGLELEVARYSMIFFMTYGAVQLPTYFKLRKQRKLAAK